MRPFVISLLFTLYWTGYASAGETEAPTFEALFDGSFINEKTGWVVGRNGTILHTNDGGQHWQVQHYVIRETEQIIRAVSFLDHSHGIAVGDSGVVLRTENGGQDWVPTAKVRNRYRIELLESLKELEEQIETQRRLTATDSPMGDKQNESPENEAATNTVERLSIEALEKKREELTVEIAQVRRFVPGSMLRRHHFSDVEYLAPDQLWILSRRSLLFSDDQGKTWQSVQLPDGEVRLNGMFFLNPQNGWIVGDGGVLFHTTDGGETFEKRELPYTWEVFDIGFSDTQNGYLVGESGLVMRTEDGGETWRQIEIDVLGDLHRIAVFSATHAVASQVDGPSYHTTNGHYWHSLHLYAVKPGKPGDEFPTPIAAFRAGKQTGYLVGTYGLIAVSRDLGRNWQVVRSEKRYGDQQFEMYKSPRFARGSLDLEMGYVHPWGTVSDRYSPGLQMTVRVLFGKRLRIGCELHLNLLSSNETIVAPAGEIEEAPVEMSSYGFVAEFPLLVDFSLFEFNMWQISVNLGVGPRNESLDLHTKWEDKVDPDDYNRSRWGIALSQGVAIGYTFAAPNGKTLLPPQQQIGRMGFYLRLGLRESWTWNVKESRVDLGTKDEKDFKTTFWPYATLGWAIYF